jgi:hypothetical protein
MDKLNNNIVVGNPRGLNAPNWGMVVKTAIVCMTESKLASVHTFTVMGLLGPRFDGFFSLPVVGMAGGIIMVWQGDTVHVSHT